MYSKNEFVVSRTEASSSQTMKYEVSYDAPKGDNVVRMIKIVSYDEPSILPLYFIGREPSLFDFVGLWREFNLPHLDLAIYNTLHDVDISIVRCTNQWGVFVAASDTSFIRQIKLYVLAHE